MTTRTPHHATRSFRERRRRIVAAARHLFLRHGVRATTMEAIAREAGIAKPTLYSYFPDREAVFEAVVDDLAAVTLERVDAALAGEEKTDAVERVAAAVSARYKTVARLLENSPHAGELYGDHQHSATAAFRRTEQTVEAAIVQELAAAGVVRPRQRAQLFLAAADGVSRKATAIAEIGPAIRLLAERLLRPDIEAAIGEPGGAPVR